MLRMRIVLHKAISQEAERERRDDRFTKVLFPVRIQKHQGKEKVDVRDQRTKLKSRLHLDEEHS